MLPSRPILNALRILEKVADAGQGLTLSEIGRHSGIPKATALRYLAAFEHAGYAICNPDSGKYSLGAKVLALPKKFYGAEGLLAVVRARLPDLAKVTEETAHIGVLQLPDIVYVDIAESPQRIRAIVPRGEHLPAYCVASGRAILAHSSEEIVENVIAGGLKQRTKFTIVKPAAYRAELKRIARDGYAANIGEWVEDVVGISAPLFGPEGQVFAAIGVSLPMSRVKPKRIKVLGDIVRSFAGELSSNFGSFVKNPTK
jgi:DNA-binding IclR family transcriptional regulator